ncbi:UNVERIFIED_ORG: hypothetical protein M2438_003122 [Methylobacterium sp. SuP10 SLI 274]|nr:hypothetical protein [Methylorubrum extorquens]MDF9792667.1 hypothetical protein [Methylorubrum extorquens]MDF9864360.1 hypothetical protein [Methylorubrum pseudosasae]MDH6637947.1 hypothetical protein [Methylobacterium sp. SuP10 SLI 274]MDH6667130.1 hypothetical protein [Methylorubrum zatmanii]
MIPLHSRGCGRLLAGVALIDEGDLDAGLERIKAIVRRQKNMPPEGNDDGFLLRAQDGGLRFLRPHARIRRCLPTTPLLKCGRADAVALDAALTLS